MPEDPSSVEELGAVEAPLAGGSTGMRWPEWRLVALLFLIALVNYFDRQSLSVMAPRMQAELRLADSGYAHVVSLFLFASAVAYGLSGFLADRFGTLLWPVFRERPAIAGGAAAARG